MSITATIIGTKTTNNEIEIILTNISKGDDVFKDLALQVLAWNPFWCVDFNKTIWM